MIRQALAFTLEMADYTSQITTPAQPSIGSPGEVYDRLFFSQTLSNIGNYAKRLTSVLGTLFGPRGGKYLNTPYGAFQDTTTQTAAANTATALKFNTTDFSNGVVVESTTKLRVSQGGIYNLQFSVQLQNIDTQLHDVSIWLRQDAAGAGTDIVGSTGLVSVPNSHGGVNGHTIVGWNYFVTLNANDFVEIWWSTESTNVTIETYAAGTSPTRPSTASAVATLSFVSNLSV
ncbi:hypothetical protein UFOVP189_54 [uncultured Caudovirales phage]|uniref:Uncharacterized protein n=1 Tax=uncultured Caudovirales phage TaxID=2100421 RepID=A0A6J7WG18_9CAUD|nr:hypothetical protein UFOVP189_54 [uncultured Caudovirales phage]